MDYSKMLQANRSWRASRIPVAQINAQTDTQTNPSATGHLAHPLAIMNTANWETLIPELKEGNNGAGIDPEDWVGCTGNFQLAAAYSLIFWPMFVEIDGMVFRGDDSMDRATLDNWLAHCDGNKARVEATLNHLHIRDIHYLGCPDASAERLVYLGRVLKQIYTIKLASEFPGRTFTVDFYEPPDQNLDDYQITFYQQHDTSGRRA